MTVIATRDASVDADLAQREAIIERGLRTFLDVGRELVVIREQRLYYQDYSSFEDYCRDRWQMDSRNANRTIEASSIAIALGSMDPTLVPTSVRQARELTGLKPEVAAEVMAKAHEDTAGKVTAKTISEAREQVAPKPPTPPTASEPKPKRHLEPVLSGERLAKYDAEKISENFGAALGSLEGLMIPEHRARVLNAWKTGALGATPHNRELHTPATLRHLADALITYAAEMELANV